MLEISVIINKNMCKTPPKIVINKSYSRYYKPFNTILLNY